MAFAAIVVVALLVFVSGMMYWSIQQQIKDSDAGASVALHETPVNEAAAIVYARVKSASIVKTSSLFLAFLLVFLGSGFVLLPVRSAYTAQMEGREVKGTLRSSSPGLILSTIGVFLAIAALYVKADFTYQEQSPVVTQIPADTSSSRTDFSQWPSTPGQK